MCIYLSGCCRQQKDVALISLSNILHQVRYSNEAAIVVHTAVDISRELNVNYFMLGNIYAVMTGYLLLQITAGQTSWLTGTKFFGAEYGSNIQHLFCTKICRQSRIEVTLTALTLTFSPGLLWSWPTHMHKISSLKFSRFKRKSGKKRTDGWTWQIALPFLLTRLVISWWVTMRVCPNCSYGYLLLNTQVYGRSQIEIWQIQAIDISNFTLWKLLERREDSMISRWQVPFCQPCAAAYKICNSLNR